MIKLNIHLIVDVITNSSTVIYTWQNSVKEAKELLQEILNLLDVKKNVDDLFYFGVFQDNNDHYIDKFCDEDIEDLPEDWKQQENYFESLKERIMKGEIVKPDWMVDCEKENGNHFAPDTSLHIMPKDIKYTKLVDKMINFLNSPNSDGERDG